MTCPFCERIARGDITLGSALAVAFPDAFPISHGHTLIVPRRCVADYFQLRPGEQQALWRLLVRIKARLDSTNHPAGYNFGVNAGEVAGQTVRHAHIHLIPRYAGDLADPRGGIRMLFPNKGVYW